MAFVKEPSPGSGHDYFHEICSYISSLLGFNWQMEQNRTWKKSVLQSEPKIYGADLQAQVKNGRIMAHILQGI